MRLKVFCLVSIFSFIFFSCNTREEEEAKIIELIYNDTSRRIPVPPKDIDSFLKLENKDYSKLNYKEHHYAVNLLRFQFTEKKEISNIFKKRNDSTIFDKNIEISNAEYYLINKLVDIERSEGGLMDKGFLKKAINKNIKFVNLKEEFISNEEKEQYKVDRVLHFSDVIFNEEMNKAVVGVVNYGGRLDSSLTLYILSKEHGKWYTRFYKIIEKS